MWSRVKETWFFNVRGDVLAGTVVALALIPEALAFSVIAGVDPKVGLYAAFCIATVSAFAGGRPGMISAATGSVALVMMTLVRDYGLQYLLAATLLAGAIQIVFGICKLGNLMRFVSRSVITGFVNALAILIFLAQLPELIGKGSTVWLLAAAGLAIIYLLPRITRAVPSPLVCIIVLTAVCMALGLQVPSVGDKGALPDSLPVFLLPDIPLNWQTLSIIFPVSLTMAIVGLLETMMTATIVDDMTDTPSDKNQECRGQGMANIASGLLGGMAGCAMIGQTVINIKSGGRGRLSTLVAGVVLLILVVFLGPWVSQIPMAALVAVMVMVSISTFSWISLRNLASHPPSSSVVMLTTVVMTVFTNNLAIGVGCGVLLSVIFYANKVDQMFAVESDVCPQTSRRHYYIEGQVFFTSAGRFLQAFDFKDVAEHIIIDVRKAHFWDITAIEALDKVVLKFRSGGAEVELAGLNAASAALVNRYAMHDKA